MKTHPLLLLLLALLVGPGRADEADARELWKHLAPAFRPPARLAGDGGAYRSPLLFDNGERVKDAAGWQKRRQEILDNWHELMGPWPAPLSRPNLEYLSKEPLDGMVLHHVRIEVAPGHSTEDAYLLTPQGGQGKLPAALVVFYDGKTGIGRSKHKMLDFAYQLAKRGFVTLSIGSPPATFYPSKDKAQLQPLWFHACVAANCYQILASRPQVDPKRIGIIGHSYGGKWALFGSCLCDKYACAVWSDPGIVFDEKRGNVNYWEPWYLGHEPGKERKAGIPTEKNPRTGAYKRMVEKGHDLHELHALMAPRPFLVSGGSEDPPERWKALHHTMAVNKLLGFEDRVAMTNRTTHGPTEESNAQVYRFFEYFLKHGMAVPKEEKP